MLKAKAPRVQHAGWWLGIFAWVGLWSFWLCSTRGYHPTFALALIVTTSLMAAYTTAAGVNHLVLIPRFWCEGLPGRYVAGLIGTMLLLTAAGLAIIRLTYHLLWGPDADPYGVYKHFAIDFFGMAVHLAVAAIAVWVFGRISTVA